MNQDSEQVLNINESKQSEQFIENASVIFEICKSEYENERSRTNTIDSKISIITAIVTALIVAIFSTIDFNVLLSKEINTVKDAIYCCLLVFFSIGSLLTTSISLFILLFSLMTKAYVVIDSYEYLQIEYLEEKKCYYNLVCANKYAECCKHNREVNEKRCKQYNISIILLLIALSLFIFYYILSSFI